MYLIVSDTLIMLAVSGQPQPVLLVPRRSGEWISSQMNQYRPRRDAKKKGCYKGQNKRATELDGAEYPRCKAVLARQILYRERSRAELSLLDPRLGYRTRDRMSVPFALIADTIYVAVRSRD